jgi:group I intron endonuclease
MNKIKLIKLYENAKLSRDIILLENDGKSGIYIWINKINNKYYIGSSKNLGNKATGRINRYFRPSYLITKGKSLIKDAIKKDGFENFNLGILEYCLKEDLTKREQYYIDLLNPEYNILLKIYSSSKKRKKKINKLSKIYMIQT